MRYVLRPLGLRPDALQGAKVTSRVHFDNSAATTFDLAVELIGSFPALSRETAQQVMAATHELPLQSRDTRQHRGDPERPLTHPVLIQR